MEKQVFVDKSSVFVLFWCWVLLMFSERLKNLRLSRGEKQSDVADGVGITRASLSTYELGLREPSFAMIGKLAQYFDVSPAYFFADTENIPKLNALAEKYECLLSRPDAQALLDYLLNQPEGDRDRILKALLSMFGVCDG